MLVSHRGKGIGCGGPLRAVLLALRVAVSAGSEDFRSNLF